MTGSGRRNRDRIERKNAEDLDKMAAAGHIARLALETAAQAAVPGVSSLELDKIAEDVIRSAGATPSFKGYRGYPGSLCVEINDVVVHGIPRSDEVINEGDIVGLDVGAYFEGFHGDTALTVLVEPVSEEARLLVSVTEKALMAAIDKARAGNTIGDIARAVEELVESHGFSCVRDLVGHGIGRQLHEAPQVPNFYEPGQFSEYDLKLRPGMTLAIEPMVNTGTAALIVGSDGWTMRTADGGLSAHVEHTVAVTKDEPIILSKVRGKNGL